MAQTTINGISDGDTIWAVINDDGSGAAPFTLPVTGDVECNYSNNIVAFVVNAPTPLGVEMLSFTAHKQGDIVALNWRTVSEINNDYFIVQKSTDGIHFRNIDTILGAGTTTSISDYFTYDESPNIGINYYRLLQLDFDGQYSFSEIRSIDFTQESFVLFPNPAKNQAFILNPFSSATYSMYDVSGKFIMSADFSESKHLIDISHLNSGIYILHISGNAANSESVIKLKVD